MKIHIYGKGMRQAREVEIDMLRVWNTMTEVYFPDPDAACEFLESLEVDEYLLMAHEDGVLDYTGEVILNRDVGVRIKAYPLSCVTFTVEPDRLRR